MCSPLHRTAASPYTALAFDTDFVLNPSETRSESSLLEFGPCCVRIQYSFRCELTGGREPAGADRRIPTWASQVVSGLARDRPAVVTKADLTLRLAEAGCERDPDSAIRELRRIGWLVQLPVKGTWAFIPRRRRSL